MLRRVRIGLVLSGGGVRGLAHIGIVQALREAGIEVAEVAGASAGALVAVMTAADCSIDEMLEFWTDSKPFELSHVALKPTGMFDPETYVGLLRRYVKHETFEALPRRLVVAVTAMAEGRVHYVDSGNLWPLVLASAAFPLVFTPVEAEGELYMDGGIIDNLPVEPLRGSCDFIIAVDVSPLRPLDPGELKSPRELIARVIDIRFAAQEQRDDVDMLIIPRGIMAFTSFDTQSMVDIYETGLTAGREAIGEIKDRIKKKP